MPPTVPDPNRFASGVEAASVAARARVEQANVAVATQRRDLAQESMRAARERFNEVEAAYRLSQAALDDAAEYATLATQQLDASLRQLATARALLHPVRKMPLELLGAIFSYCLDRLPPRAGTAVVKRDAQKRQEQPFQLAAVCRRWRQASLSCPYAWSSLELFLDACDNGKALLTYTTYVLSRSRNAPLCIRITRARANETKDKQLVTPIQQAMHRCSVLILDVDCIQGTVDTLLPLLAASSPVLHSFYLVAHSDSVSCRGWHLLRDSPNLRCLFLGVRILRDHPVVQSLEIVDLFVLVVLPSGTHDGISALFNMAPNLKKLTLNNCLSGLVIRPAPVTFASVTSLRVVHDGSEGFGTEFIRQCRFPRLESLSLHGGVDGSLERVDSLSVILPHSPNLGTLTIDTVLPYDFAARVRALQHASALTVLAIRRSTFTRASLRLLSDTLGLPETDDGVWTCPALNTLILDTCTFSEDCALDDIVRLVAQRQRAAADPVAHANSRPVRLRILKLPDDLDAAIISHLETLLQQQ